MNKFEENINAAWKKYQSEKKDELYPNIMLLGISGAGEYYGAAEPPVRCGESHLSGLTESPHFIY